jgi:uncharacterized coiled-coil protein SlyX
MTNEERITKLEETITTQQEFIEQLKSFNTIPLEVGEAFKNRLGNNNLTVSLKSSSSENQAVSEGGSAIYSVLKPPDGFDERIENGIIKYYPYYV